MAQEKTLTLEKIAENTDKMLKALSCLRKKILQTPEEDIAEYLAATKHIYNKIQRECERYLKQINPEKIGEVQRHVRPVLNTIDAHLEEFEQYT